MIAIPLLPVPSQTLQITLDGQQTQISVFLLNAGVGTSGVEPDASSTEVTADSTQFTADLDTTLAGAFSSQLYANVSVSQTAPDGTNTQVPIVTTRPILTSIPILLSSTYLGFIGELLMVDTSGLDTQPVYTGLGAQYQLVYLDADDIAQALAA